MADNEIIQAFELCLAEKSTKQTCGKCSYHQFGELCKVKRNRDALDLIHCLQEQNAGLISGQETLQKYIAEKDAEIEQMRKSWQQDIEDKNEFIRERNTEIEDLNSRIFALNNTNKILVESQEVYWKNRVKEFAERLCEDRVSNDPVVIAVKAELKMVGADE